MNFRERIYFLTRQIPPGKVATYGQLARLAGKPGAARAVGACMRVNPDAPTTPCHRVVAADGSLHGFFGKHRLLDRKQALLQTEGVVVCGDRVDLKQYLWENDV